MSEEVIETPEVVNEAPETTTPPEATAAPETEAPETTEPPAYTPDFKFKVDDQEKELDEWIRPFVKDKETEQKFKDFAQKAYGLEVSKSRGEQWRKEADTYKSEYAKIYQDVADVFQRRDAGDLSSVLQKLGITEQQMAKYLIEQQQRKELPPEQRQVYDNEERLKRERFEREREFEMLNQRYLEVATQAREAQVDFALQRPEVQQIANAYDAENGKGAFKSFIAETAVAYQHIHGREPSVDVAVNETIRRAGRGWMGMKTQAPLATSNEGVKPPVIPNISGKSTSPVKKHPMSVKEMRQMIENG